MKSAFMQGPVGKLLPTAGFSIHHWTLTQRHDARVTPDHTYEADRFKKGEEEERGKDIEDALKEWMEVINTWFDECK